MLAGTTLADAPVFPLSGQTGEGVPAPRAALETAAQDVADRTAGGNFRLAVDRCFTIAGSGLVVTGTVFSGAVRVGDRSEEHTSELQSLMRITYAVFRLKKKKTNYTIRIV